MTVASFFADLYESLTVSDVHAEAPPAEPEAEEPAQEKEEEVEEAAPEEEEEEEDEPEDPMPALLEECEKTPACAPAKHHFDECVERVTAAADDENAKGPKEDCVEEFFHLMHCTTQCAAPKLFAKLK
ncbi:ubiquinol-cytochrome c reductase subunit 6 [Pyronema omphalodes]|nr:ubiquinol-cytochrome c reductase subunit 6 [Pyronema omphalodes]